jgi:predicted nucleotidyltransferase
MWLTVVPAPQRILTVMSGTAPSVRLPMLVRRTLDAFLAGLRDRFGPRLLDVRLFGSYARGEAHEESDVDCLVLLDRVERGDDRTVTDLAADLVWQIGGVVISPLVMSADQFDAWKAGERRVPLAIEREGIRL